MSSYFVTGLLSGKKFSAKFEKKMTFWHKNFNWHKNYFFWLTHSKKIFDTKIYLTLILLSILKNFSGCSKDWILKTKLGIFYQVWKVRKAWKAWIPWIACIAWCNCACSMILCLCSDSITLSSLAELLIPGSPDIIPWVPWAA